MKIKRKKKKKCNKKILYIKNIRKSFKSGIKRKIGGKRRWIGGKIKNIGKRRKNGLRKNSKENLMNQLITLFHK